MQNYCEETIEKVYIGQPKYRKDGQNYFFDYYYDMTLHITDGCRLVLETAHYYISVQSDGVYTSNKDGLISSIEHPGERRKAARERLKKKTIKN